MYRLQIESYQTLLEVLRNDLGLTGTKEGCDGGECGACTVLVEDRPVLSCLTLAADVQNSQITTIEGMNAGGKLDPIQSAFLQEGAVQCGFCTPGMIMSARGLLKNNPHPTIEEIKEGISGNLCRCTGYIKPVKALRKLTAKKSNLSEACLLNTDKEGCSRSNPACKRDTNGIARWALIPRESLKPPG